MKYKLRNIIAIIFIGVCIYLVTLNNQKDDINVNIEVIDKESNNQRGETLDDVLELDLDLDLDLDPDIDLDLDLDLDDVLDFDIDF